MHGLFPYKKKKGTSIVNAFKKIISKGQRKPNKIWVDQGSEFYNQPFKDFLKINNIQMYSTYNEGKRFIKTLKNKIFKHMTTISKNVYIDVLNDIVNKYNNTVHRTIKIKPTDVTNDSYVKYNEDSNKKGPKFKVNDHVRISKYKNIFAKGYVPNWSEEVFIVNEIKNTVPWPYTISDLNGEPLLEYFMKKNCKRLIKNHLKYKKYLKEKVISCMLNGNGMIIHLIVGLIKKTLYKNESIFSYTTFRL